MTPETDLRERFDRLLCTYREIHDELVILQAVEGWGYMRDSQLYCVYMSTGNKLRRMSKILKIEWSKE